MSGIPVITISRQYGAGGREIAGLVAEKLGVKLYDRQIGHIAAAKIGLDDLTENDLLELENYVKPLSMSFLPFRSFGMNMSDSSQKIFMTESAAIRKLAQDGPCVILGRSADYVLWKFENKFSIFICADDEFRVARGKEVYGGKTLKELDQEDKKRARYYNYYTGQNWGEGQNYDLVVNTSHDSLDKIADAIIDYIKVVKG